MQENINLLREMIKISNIITYAETGEPARINYRIPLPGAHTGRRIIEVNLGLQENHFLESAKDLGEDIAKKIGLEVTDNGYKVDTEKAEAFLNDKFKDWESTGKISNVNIIGKVLPTIDLGQEWTHATDANKTKKSSMTSEELEELRNRYIGDGIKNLIESGIIYDIGKDWAGRDVAIPIKPLKPKKPRFLLVEYYGISSFLGDYGMGRTVKTFTLLPGESTTIALRTWQSSSKSIAESSSIIDSHEQSAREQFSDKVSNETTDKVTDSKTHEWHVAAEAGGSWGVASCSVETGASGAYHSEREQFSHQLSEAVSEHAAEASSKRELSVTSSSERTSEEGQEELIERTISNVNMRRVLNFVFRELNQEYVTKLHLKDIRIAFTNGHENVWREVPLSGLHSLLKEVLVSDMIEEVAQKILKVAGIVFDNKDHPVITIEKVTIDENGGDIKVDNAQLQQGEFPAPSENVYYRFQRGPLNQDKESNPVDGVLLSEKNIVMRTDSVIVEALLGQADALDNYAMQIQEAAADEKTLANNREKLIHETLNKISDPMERARMAAKLFNPCCSEED